MLCVKCDLCGKVLDDTHIAMVKWGDTAGRTEPVEMAAHVCDECWKKHNAPNLIHMLRSLGFKEPAPRQRPAGPPIDDLKSPVPVDLNLVRKLQGRS